MGKSPKPLSFLIHPSLIQSDEDRRRIEDLRAQGHVIQLMDGGMRQIDLDLEPQDADLVLGPNCWRAFDLRHLDLAIKSARSVKYGTAKAKVAKKPRTPRKKKGDKGLEQS